MKKICNLLIVLALLISACQKEEKSGDVKPMAAFETQITKNMVTAVNKSQDGLKHTWNFGDGSKVVVTEKCENVNHVYAETGSFEIILTVENMGGKSEAQKSVTITEITEKTEAKTEDAINASITKFTAPYALIDGDPSNPGRFFLQLSKKEDFSELEEIYTERYFSVKELELTVGNTAHEFKNLDPEETYFYRVRIENSEGESFSNVSQGNTKGMDGIASLSIDSSQPTMFEVKRSVIDIDDNCLEVYPEHKELIFATDPEFTHTITPELTHIFDTYYREAGLKVYVQSTVEFKGKQLKLTASVETTDNVVARQTDERIFRSATTAAYPTAIVLGNPDGERITINIPVGTDKKGVYTIKPGTDQTPNNFYLNYYDSENKKYSIESVYEAELEIYRIEDNNVFGRIKNPVTFKMNEGKQTVSFSPIIFKAAK
ncbi:PKD domain-containing protein [Marinilabiliaceae bacterium JC017]|nr:PKD domain-containing protein [Marinilabiliaceae bacterium JC017]